MTLKLTKKKTIVLKHLLNQRPFDVYIHRGFTGFANPRLQILSGAEGLNVAAFNWLKKRDFVRKLATDDFKELWDISETGIAALQEVDDQTADIDTRFLARRLQSPFNNYAFDSIGLIGLRHKRPTGKCADILPKRLAHKVN